VELVARQAGAEAASAVGAALDEAARRAEASHRSAATGRAAMALIGALDRISPALGRAAESVILGDAARRLRRRLGR
jgi:hypothetical protein